MIPARTGALHAQPAAEQADCVGAELTLRGVLLGVAITLIFTAANIYIGLKVGWTFASSIPAAVISMATLRTFKGAGIHENTIVQTVASAAGTLSMVIFVLPGLVMVGWWNDFPFWPTFGICVVGGILGVMYSVPLRRALVTTSDLPYPEGVAAAEILKVGAGSRGKVKAETLAENQAGLIAVATGALASMGFALLTATRLLAGQIAAYARLGPAATGVSFSFSLALLGAGHLIGVSVGVALLAGLFLAWGVATPLLTFLHPLAGSAVEVATNVWAHQVRFIGAGIIGVAALWTFIKLARPVCNGVLASIAASRPSSVPIIRTERDLPIQVVALISLIVLIPLAALLAFFLVDGALAPIALPLVLGTLVYVVLAGFLVAAACGYMAGLVGSSNSPVSGLAILSVIGATLLLALLPHGASTHAGAVMVAYALFVSSIVLCVATISNDNLQDLKTGQLVGATPWRQQVALLVGVVVGALVIPPILNLLAHAYGFVGAANAHVTPGTQPLPAPQATLISALAKGVIDGKLAWNLIGIGAVIGVVTIALDEWLIRGGRFQFPPLALGLGLYLPASSMLPVIVGAMLGRLHERRAEAGKHPAVSKRFGVLLASGLIVGESFFGVLTAVSIVTSGKAMPFALVGDAFAPFANWLGVAAFALTVFVLYAWITRLGERLRGKPVAP
jgi:putative OPT family oligopeptide transporter